MATTVDLGKVRPVWKGTWSGSTAYEVHDMVKVGVNSYICTVGHTSSGTFSNDSANWETLAVGAELPAQSGNAGKALVTDGTNLLWDVAAVPNGSAVYTSVGSHTFTVPSDVTQVFVSGCGGGGGSYSGGWGTGGGGAGATFRARVTGLTPGQNITVTVGGGGSSGGNGGASSFGSYVNLYGGTAGEDDANRSGSQGGNTGSLAGGVYGIIIQGGRSQHSDHSAAGTGKGGDSFFGHGDFDVDKSTAPTGYGAGARAGWGTSYRTSGKQGFILVEW
jgi:hypothetical protein